VKVNCVSGQKGGQQGERKCSYARRLIREVIQLVQGQWECSVKRRAGMCTYECEWRSSSWGCRTWNQVLGERW